MHYTNMPVLLSRTISSLVSVSEAEGRSIYVNAKEIKMFLIDLVIVLYLGYYGVVLMLMLLVAVFGNKSQHKSQRQR